MAEHTHVRLRLAHGWRVGGVQNFGCARYATKYQGWCAHSTPALQFEMDDVPSSAIQNATPTATEWLCACMLSYAYGRFETLIDGAIWFAIWFGTGILLC